MGEQVVTTEKAAESTVSRETPAIASFLPRHTSEAPASPKTEKKAPDVKVEAKPDEAKAQPKIDAKATEKPTDTPPEKKPAPVEAKTEPEKTVEPEKVTEPAIDWKARAEKAEKQYTDTRNYSTQVNQQLAELKRQNEVLAKKIDGTYDPAVDDAPAGPTREQQLEAERFKLKADAARDVAREQLGVEFMDKAFAVDGPFHQLEKARPDISQRVWAAPNPYLEAAQALDEELFFREYGTRKPDKIVEAILNKYAERIEKDVRAKVTKEYEEKLEKQAKQPSSSLVAARGTGTPPPTKEDATNSPRSIADFLPRKRVA